MRANSSAQTREVYAVSIERVGPSNRARVAELLRTAAGLSAEDAVRLVHAAPCELVTVNEELVAEALRTALNDAGVVAKIETRQIVVPPPIVLPDRAVHLESVGEDRISVMKVVRAHVDLGVADAKRLVDGAPCVLVEALEGGRAASFVAALVDAGATARLG